MANTTPIGSVCPYAGQVNPISGSPNDVWPPPGANGCGAVTPAEADAAEAPINHLEADGWMLCDGRYLGVAEYPELFAVLGYLYGQSTTDGARFRIPDYRGLFLRGVDAGAGMDPQAGERNNARGDAIANTVGSLQCGALEDHTHNYQRVTVSGVSSSGSAAGVAATSEPSGSPNPPALVGAETRPKNIAVNYIIRFR